MNSRTCLLTSVHHWNTFFCNFNFSTFIHPGWPNLNTFAIKKPPIRAQNYRQMVTLLWNFMKGHLEKNSLHWNTGGRRCRLSFRSIFPKSCSRLKAIFEYFWNKIIVSKFYFTLFLRCSSCPRRETDSLCLDFRRSLGVARVFAFLFLSCKVRKSIKRSTVNRGWFDW